MKIDDPITGIGEIIRAAAVGIAEAQWELDKSSMAVAELMTGQQMLRDPDTGRPLTQAGEPLDESSGGRVGVRDSRVFFGHHFEDGRRVPTLVSMMELGFTPNFYQFVDTVIEVKLAMKMSRGADGEAVLSASPLDATYAASYSFDAELTSSVRTKIVSIPPPALLDERIRDLMGREEEVPSGEGDAAVEEGVLPELLPLDRYFIGDLEDVLSADLVRALTTTQPALPHLQAFADEYVPKSRAARVLVNSVSKATKLSRKAAQGELDRLRFIAELLVLRGMTPLLAGRLWDLDGWRGAKDLLAVESLEGLKAFEGAAEEYLDAKLLVDWKQEIEKPPA